MEFCATLGGKLLDKNRVSHKEYDNLAYLYTQLQWEVGLRLAKHRLFCLAKWKDGQYINYLHPSAYCSDLHNDL